MSDNADKLLREGLETAGVRRVQVPPLEPSMFEFGCAIECN